MGMADGYARISGKPGVVLTITGPGALNASASLATAYADSSPVFLIASTIPAAAVDQGRGAMHEVKDQLGVFRSLAKWAGRASAVREIPEAVNTAFQEMLNGRPLPTYLEIPTDVLYAKEDVEEVAWARTGAERQPPPPDPAKIAEAAEAIAAGTNPVIWAGGGVHRSAAWEELRELAETAGAPVVTTSQARDAFPADHPLSVWGHVMIDPVYPLVEAADPLVAVGSRFTEEATRGWSTKVPENLVHIDIEAGAIGRSYPARVGIVADAKPALRQITEALRARGTRANGGAETTGRVNAETEAYYRGIRPAEAKVLDDIQSALPRDAIVVSDATRVNYWASVYTRFYEPGSWIYPGAGTLGLGLPMGLGAKLARPERPVVVLVGDGGFQYSLPELITAAHYDLPVTVLLGNDSAYGVLIENQEMFFGPGRNIDVALENPDFGAIARAYGAGHVALKSWDGVGEALEAGIGSGRLNIVEVQAGITTPPLTTF
jgi:acetolactate synthase-1/2/3 large subunit